MERLSLLGGPLHRLACRLGLIRSGTNTMLLGIVLGASLWTVLVLLTLVEGVGPQVFSLSRIAGHVRLLVVIPLFFLCESWLDPRLTTFVGTIMRSGVVPGSALPALDSEIARLGRLRESWVPEAAFLLGAVLLSSGWGALQGLGTTAAFDPARGGAEGPLVARWYWFVCLPLFRFLMLRWLWRIALWSYFLWRLSRLDLHLVATHPDRMGGLGYLEVVHSTFVPLAAAISVLESASFAEGLSAGTMQFAAIYPALALTLLVDAALFVAPLLVFAPKLLASRERGLDRYMVLAARYVDDFDEKWLGAKPSGEALLGTPDLQSLADLASSVDVVRDMRFAPVSARLVTYLAVAAVLPVLPLALFVYPAAELTQKFFMMLSGQ